MASDPASKSAQYMYLFEYKRLRENQWKVVLQSTLDKTLRPCGNKS